jgi:hypothetical protein
MKILMSSFSRDGRKSPEEIHEIISNCLLKENWISEKISHSEDRERTFPIISYRTPNSGNGTIYLLSGIHGEEPAGPNAIANSIESLVALGKERPVVLVPILNPAAYNKDWRYIDQRRWDGIGISVNDTEHLMVTDGKPRKEQPSCREALEVNNFFVSMFKQYQPRLMIDFHEDELEQEGAYAYSHGRHGAKDEIGKRILAEIKKSGIPLKIGENKETRWEQKIIDGFVSFENDSSIDDFFSAQELWYNGKIINGPNTETAIATELPTNLPLELRCKAYESVIRTIRNFPLNN